MEHRIADPNRVIALILGGGAGTRLFPLTQERAKPAVPLAGKYRLVDIPISLCINSGYKRVFLLTQFLSSSLHRHVTRSYRFDDYVPHEFVEIMAATQTFEKSSGWYQGTADAVRQNLTHFRNHEHDLVLILSGDQLYRMDFRDIIASHVTHGADVTVATIPVSREPASGFGIMQVDDKRRITRFVEKPTDDAVLDSMRLASSEVESLGRPGQDELYLASMGIYVFNRSVLEKALDNASHTDFGKHIIPDQIQAGKTYSYIYQGYWEDIGTIKAFYTANLDLCEPVPQFNFFDALSPIYSRARFLPASKVIESKMSKVVIADGCIISGAEITRSIIGIRSRIGEGTVVTNSILMGNDNYETPNEVHLDQRAHRPQLGIGTHCRIEGAIIDKNVRIGSHVTITNQGKSENMDGENFYVRDGIVIIPKSAEIPDGTII
ncbi:MAG: glucose-1-phosphate adenylyltransferase [Candidatus Methylacidiphilales bacterium]